MPKTQGVSPKVVVDAVVSIVSFAIVNGLISLDPALSAVIAKALGTLAAVVAPPGDVVVPSPGAPSDDALMANRQARRGMEGGQSPINVLLWLVVAVVAIIVLVWLLRVLGHAVN